MPAIDHCEPQVIRAFEKEGWRLIEKPFFMRTGHRIVLADFSAAKGVNGDKRQIVVTEVKCFADRQQDMPNLYTAAGQYMFYRHVLDTNNILVPLYLAMPMIVYQRLVQDPVVLRVFRKIRIRFVLVDLEKAEIEQWID